jgi:hypothetical protein
MCGPVRSGAIPSARATVRLFVDHRAYRWDGICPKAASIKLRFRRHQKAVAGTMRPLLNWNLLTKGRVSSFPTRFEPLTLLAQLQCPAQRRGLLSIILNSWSLDDTPVPHSRETYAPPGAGNHHAPHSFQRSRHGLRFVDHIYSCFARSAQLWESSLRTPSTA